MDFVISHSTNYRLPLPKDRTTAHAKGPAEAKPFLSGRIRTLFFAAAYVHAFAVDLHAHFRLRIRQADNRVAGKLRTADMSRFRHNAGCPGWDIVSYFPFEADKAGRKMPYKIEKSGAEVTSHPSPPLGITALRDFADARL